MTQDAMMQCSKTLSSKTTKNHKNQKEAEK